LALVHLFKTMFLLHHATLARRDTFLQATANFLQDPQFPWVSSFGSPCHPATRCQPLCCFFIVPEDFTAASSVGTSWCSDSDSISILYWYLVEKFLTSPNT
jgi:hypothetical protein